MSPMSDNLKTIRNQLKTWNVDAVYVPHEDSYLNEYLPPDQEVLAWLTGFTGSAGVAIVTNSEAGLFVDGRYPIQARGQVSKDWTVLEVPLQSMDDWLSGKCTTIGYDPSCMAVSRFEALKEKFDKIDVTMVALDDGVIHSLENQTISKNNTLFQWDTTKHEGRDFKDKLALVRDALKKHHIDGAVIGDATLVSWLTGLRAQSIPRSPQILGRVFVTQESCQLMLDQNYADQSSIKIDIQIVSQFEIGQTMCIGYDPNTVPQSLVSTLKNTKKIKGLFEDIRCIKTHHSRKVIKEVLRRDNEIMDNFFKWLVEYLKTKKAYEHEIAIMIAEARAKHDLYVDESFDAIVGFRENSAIIHYHPTKGSDKLVHGDGVLLIDSGGQYVDGTTDRTTTLLLGDVGDKARHVYETVVKAHEALARAIFPKGTTGAELATIPNQILWEQGFKCPHGIGHGVGQFLSVHEGPYNISPRSMNIIPEGLLVSNEPGVYFENEFGVRHERLHIVEENMDHKGFLKFSS